MSIYKSAGVDIHAGYRSVELMRENVEKTFSKYVLNGLGGFGGLYELPEGYKKPVLVSGTDGVGTKLKIAFLLDKHDTIGQDCVAMCVNDIICSGATPLFFIDYVALGKNIPEKVAEIVGGVAQACSMAGCSLIGGETAEMPGMYPPDEYDIAGFAVGIVEKDKIIDGNNVNVGDAVVGIASSGLHSNGYSLVRKLLRLNSAHAREHIDNYIDELGCTLGEELLRPTRIYAKALKAVSETISLKAVSHITGGGFYENIPRMLKDGVSVKLYRDSYIVPPIFKMLQTTDNISASEMYNTFNMGIGMVLVVDKHDANTAVKLLTEAGETAYIIGETIAGERGCDI